jgi:hypothetical protein
VAESGADRDDRHRLSLSLDVDVRRARAELAPTLRRRRSSAAPPRRCLALRRLRSAARSSGYRVGFKSLLTMRHQIASSSGGRPRVGAVNRRPYTQADIGLTMVTALGAPHDCLEIAYADRRHRDRRQPCPLIGLSRPFSDIDLLRDPDWRDSPRCLAQVAPFGLIAAGSAHLSPITKMHSVRPHARPNPARARARAVTVPSTGSSRLVRTAPAMSRYSNQEAIGDTAITCALGSTKVWFDNGSAAAADCAIAANQPVTPLIFMMSTIARSDAPTAMAFGNHQFSPV